MATSARAALDALNKKYGVSNTTSTSVKETSNTSRNDTSGVSTRNSATSAMEKLREKYGTVNEEPIAEEKKTQKKAYENTRFYNSEEVKDSTDAMSRIVKSSALNTKSALQGINAQAIGGQNIYGYDYMPTSKAEEEQMLADNKVRSKEEFAKASETAKRSEKELELAKEGKGALAQFAIDVARGGADLVTDAIVGTVTGGVGGLASLGARAFGNSMVKAMEENPNASWGEVTATGLSTAAVEIATEKLFGAAFKGIYGKGLLDGKLGNIAKNVMGKVGSSPKGVQMFLKLAKDFVEEGSEEVISDLINPAIRSIYNDKTIAENVKDLKAEEVLYDFLIGGTLGAIGGGTQLIGSASAIENTDVTLPTQTNADTTISEKPSNVVAKQENAPQDVTEPSKSQVDTLVEMVKNGGSVSNNMAERVMADMNAMAELGIETTGKTKSEIRKEIKAAINTKAINITPTDVNNTVATENTVNEDLNVVDEEVVELEEILAELEQTRANSKDKLEIEDLNSEIDSIKQEINFKKQYASEGPSFDNKLQNAIINSGIKTTQAPQNSVPRFTGEQKAERWNNASQQAHSVVDRLNNGEDVSLEEIVSIPEVGVGLDFELNETSTIDLPNRENIRANAVEQLLSRGSFSGVDENGNELFNGEIGHDKICDIVIGLPGSGKSSAYSNQLSAEHKSRIIDTDEARAYIPEYNGANSGVVHREASLIKNSVYEYAIENSENILLSVIGDNPDKLKTQIDVLASLGYVVNLHLNELPNSKSMARAIKRYISEGRFVSPHLIYNYGNKPTETFLLLTGNLGGNYGLLEIDTNAEIGVSDEEISRRRRESMAARAGKYAETQRKVARYSWKNNDVNFGEPPRLIYDSASTNPAEQSVGAAPYNFTGANVETAEPRTSNIADTVAKYDDFEAEASGIHDESEYREQFQYEPLSNEQTVRDATDSLYFEYDGERQFIRDFDPKAYNEITNELTAKENWNADEVDMANIIKKELQNEVMLGNVSTEEYVNWLSTMREHATRAGQEVQAWAKWSRKMNEGGAISEGEAWKALENSKLSEDERQELFNQVLAFDAEIELNQDDSAHLIDLIIKIGTMRGTLNNIFGKYNNRLEQNTRKNLEAMDLSDLVQFAYNSSASLVHDVERADIGRKLKSIQVLNMLSSPRTTTRNLLGNTSFYQVDSLSMKAAALIDMAISNFTGTRSVAMEKSVFSKDVSRAIVRGIQYSLAEITLDVDMGGKSRYGQSTGRTFKSSKGFVENIMSKIERNSAYALVTSDEAFKSAARETENATSSMIANGTIVTDNENYASDMANKLALERTFQNDSKISRGIQVVHDVLNMMLGWGDSGTKLGSHKVHAFGLGDIVAPFTKVAGNLVNVSVMYSPANMVKGAYEITKAIYNGVAKGETNAEYQAQGVTDLARGMNGTMLACVAMMLAKSGIFKRADDEDDDDVKNLNQTEGISGLQINIDAFGRLVNGGTTEWRTGDTLLDISALEPLNFIYSLGVEMADDSIEKENSIISQVGEDMISSFSDSSSELPIISNTANFVKDTMIYGKNPVDSAIQAVGKTAVSSITPNIIAGFAKGIDEKARSTTSGETNADIIVDTFKSRVPWLRETLPTKVNSLGEEQKVAGNDTERFLNAIINPLGVNEYNQSDISKEMERVREATGETSFYPTTKSASELSYTDKNGEKHIAKLNYEQKQEYLAIRGTTQSKATTAMIVNSNYKKSNADTQADLLNICYKYAQEVAKGSVLGNEAMSAWVEHSQNAQSELGISQADYFYYYNRYGSNVMSGSGYDKTVRMVNAGLTVDEYASMKAALEGKEKKQDLIDYLNSTGKSRSEKKNLFSAWNDRWKNPY